MCAAAPNRRRQQTLPAGIAAAAELHAGPSRRHQGDGDPDAGPGSSARIPAAGLAIESSSMSDPALHGALDDFPRGLRFRQFVARCEAAQHMDQLIDKSDEENHEATAVAELRKSTAAPR